MANITTIQLIEVEDVNGAAGYSTHAIVKASSSPTSADVLTAINNTFSGINATTAIIKFYDVLGIPNPGTAGNNLQDAIDDTSIIAPSVTGSYFLFLLSSGPLMDPIATYVKNNYTSSSTQTGNINIFRISSWYMTDEITVGFSSPPASGTSPFSSASSSLTNVNVHDFKQRKVLTARLKNAPIALQTMRKRIIENANEMVEQMKKYRFHEISEIVRVCTALGIERAFLRGLQINNNLGSYTVPGDDEKNELWIDKFIYRFNLNGGLPFQDIANPNSSSTWKGGGEFASPAFFHGNRNTILLQCIRTDGEPFYVCNGDSIEFATEPETQPELPLTAFIPKYRAKGFDLDIPWLPEMFCEMLFNEPHPNDVCVTTTDITGTSTLRPDLNELIPINVNSFPYTTPNAGFPYLNNVIPAPKRIRMVMDGTPIDGEDVILANRFELTGYVEINPGDPITATVQSVQGSNYPTEIFPSSNGSLLSDGDVIIITGNVQDATGEDTESPITPDSDDFPPDGTPPETREPSQEDITIESLIPESFPIVVEDGRYFSPVEIPVDYSGTVLVQRDPITGTNTKFTEELFVNDIIELQYQQSVVSGLFYTIGTDRLYYRGDFFNSVYRKNIEIVINNVRYTVIDANFTGGTLSYGGYTFEYNSFYQVTRDSSNFVYNDGVQEVVSSSLFDHISTSVNVYPTRNNRKQATIEFINNINAEETFEVGDLIIINGEYYRFKNIVNNILQGVYRVDGGNIDSVLNSVTLVRNSKTTRAKAEDDFAQGFVLPFRVYYKVGNVTSDTSIDVVPNYSLPLTYEGKIYRIGFNARSASQSPNLLNSGFNVDGVTQFLPSDSPTDNSPTFYLPKAATEKVILYKSDEISNYPPSASALTALPVTHAKGALEGAYFTPVFNYANFSQPLGTVIFPDYYDPDLDEEERGQLYFTDGTDRYIILETFEENNPVSHGFNSGDILTIRKVKYEPNILTDNPFGDLVRYNDSKFQQYMSTIDYAECGMLIEVADIVNPHRFKILKEGPTCQSEANKFFYDYNIDTVRYLTATNGVELEYWAKYFSPVFMDGTITANSYGEYITNGQNVNRTITLPSKGNNNSKLLYNYVSEASSVSYWLGSTGVNVVMNGNVVTLVPGAVGVGGASTTDDGTFLLSLKDDIVHPPNLLDSFVLRVVEFEYEEL